MKPIPSPTDGSRLAQMLDRLAQQSAKKRTNSGEKAANAAAPRPTDAGDLDHASSEDVFGAGPSGFASASELSPGAPSHTKTSGGGMLSARVAALSGDLSATGRVVHGDLTLSTPDDCKGLRGVRAILGTLSISDSMLTTADLAVLEAVVEVGGLALENNPALTSLSMLSSLTTVDGGTYVGFNPALKTLSLGALEENAGAFIVEGNPLLETVDLGGLKDLGRYLHICENPNLAAVDLSALDQLDELVLQDNPALVRVLSGAMKQPADLEVSGTDHLTLAFR